MISRKARAAAATALLLALVPFPALAQDTGQDEEEPVEIDAPPPVTTAPRERPRVERTTPERPPVQRATPERTAPDPEPVTVDPAPRSADPGIVVVPAAPAAAPPVSSVPVDISPNAPYPNGFGDPVDPYGNQVSVAMQQQEDNDFPWGLLGLLGLAGLLGLRRREQHHRAYHVERDYVAGPDERVQRVRTDTRP